MSNIEKYNEAFISSLDVKADQLEELTYQSVTTWDSVGHMGLVAEIEDAFDITMETDDIIDMNSYKKGIEILSTKYDVEF